MANVPTKVATRITAGLKRYQPIVSGAKSRDVNESDTVIILTDMLSEIFGYDKYSEITSEFCIRGTYCDLATKLDGKVQCLIEAKAAGLELKEAHTKQAVDYAANQGIEWVVLTNATAWKVYKVSFTKPIGQELIVEFDFLQMNPKKAEDIETLYLLAKEGAQRSALGDYEAQRQALNRFCLAAVIVSDSVLDVIRRELRRMSPDVRIDNEQISEVLVQEVLKRDVLEGDKAEEARRKVARAANKLLKAKAAAAAENDNPVEESASPVKAG